MSERLFNFANQVPVDISVIVCTYNRCESLQRVLDDLKSLRIPNNTSYEILIIDNNSRDNTRSVVEAVSQERPGVFRYIFEPRQGKSFALNTGVDAAKGEIIAFTDDDVRIDHEWLAEIGQAFEVHSCIGIGGRIVPVWHSLAPWWYEESGPYRLMGVVVKLDLGDAPCKLQTPAWGANLSVRRSAFVKYGKFREDLGPNAESLLRGEDSDFCWRLIQAGENMVYCPTVLVNHPVEEKRATKGYFLSWYFDYGRTTARREPNLKGTINYFGIPRYLYRQLLTDFRRWTFCLNPKRRFFYKLHFTETLGKAVEARTLSTNSA